MRSPNEREKVLQLVLSTPALYSLELTPLCNNKCPGCFNVFIDDKVKRPMEHIRSSLTAAEWRTILEKIQPHAERVKLTGGEPTLHPEFEQIVRTLGELNISFSIFTNARWRKPDQLIGYLKTFPQFVGMLISLHGADATTHEAYSGICGSFDETVTNIRRAVVAGLNVATSTVIHKHNFDQIPPIVEFSNTLGANLAVINRYLGKPLPQIETSAAELKMAVQVVEQLHHQGARVKFGTCVPQCFVGNSSTGCLAGAAYCAISPWGELRPCNHSSTVAGNLLKQSIDETWHSAEMETWRGLMPNECEIECTAFAKCHGACRALIEIRGQHRDPLRNVPIRITSNKKNAERVKFYEGLHPLANFHLRQEEFGYVAMRGNRVVPITMLDHAILQTCDGTRTLRRIQDDFGPNGLRTIAVLYKKGLVEFAEDTTMEEKTKVRD